MTGRVDTDALEALRSRLRNTEATARLIAGGAPDHDTANAFEGISMALEEQGETLDAIIADAVGKGAP